MSDCREAFDYFWNKVEAKLTRKSTIKDECCIAFEAGYQARQQEVDNLREARTQASEAALHNAGIALEHQQTIDEQAAHIERLQDFAIWMTGCHDFSQYDYFCEERAILRCDSDPAQSLAALADEGEQEQEPVAWWSKQGTMDFLTFEQANAGTHAFKADWEIPLYTHPAKELSGDEIEVNATALGQMLTALTGPGYLIREIQATIGVDAMMGHKNPLTTLVKEYNAWVEARNVADPG